MLGRVRQTPTFSMSCGQTLYRSNSTGMDMRLQLCCFLQAYLTTSHDPYHQHSNPPVDLLTRLPRDTSPLALPRGMQLSIVLLPTLPPLTPKCISTRDWSSEISSARAFSKMPRMPTSLPEQPASQPHLPFGRIPRSRQPFHLRRDISRLTGLPRSPKNLQYESPSSRNVMSKAIVLQNYHTTTCYSLIHMHSNKHEACMLQRFGSEAAAA